MRKWGTRGALMYYKAPRARLVGTRVFMIVHLREFLCGLMADDPAPPCGIAGLIPTLHSGLRISIAANCGLDSVPGPKNSMCCGCG